MKRILTICMACVLGFLAVFGYKDTMAFVSAAEPKVMVTAYKIKENEVVAGGTFTLEVTIKNTADKKISNLKMAVASEGGELIPASGAGTGYLASLEGGETYTFEFPMQAAANLEEKAYKLTVTDEYEDRYGNPYTVTDTIYLPVTIKQRGEITGVYAESDVTLGDSIEIMGSVSNLGASTLYNVKAKIDTRFTSEGDVYIGNIEPGKNGSIDILANTTKTTGTGGEMGKLIVTYEDKSGNVTTLEENFSISVNAPVYTDIEKVKDVQKKDYSKMIIEIVVAVVVAALIVIWIIRRRKRKKEILEEF